MGQEIAVNTAVLTNDIEILQKQLEQVKRDMNKIYEAVKVLDSMWDGPANSAFNQQFNQDNADMNALCDTIQKFINCMENAKQEYDLCENKVGGIVAAISV